MNQNNSSFSCLAIDMGASSIRIVLGKIEGRKIEYTEIHRIENSIKEIDGHERWDISSIFKEIVFGINRAIEDLDTIPQSIGADSWGVDFVLLDDKGELLDIPIAYRDKRTEGMMEEWEKEMSAYETFERTGINFYIFNTLFQLYSIRDSELLRKAKRIIFLPSYINYLLSGSLENEQTIASTSQVLNIDGDKWDQDIIAKIGISEDVLGEVVMPGAKLGPISNDSIIDHSIETVAVCGHDTACAIAAIPASTENFAYIATGTWCILGLESKQALINEAALAMGFTNERGYDNTFRTLKNTVGLWLIQGLKKEFLKNTSFGELEGLVKETKQTIQYIDPDDALFYNPKEMKAAFDAFFRKTNQPIPEHNAEYIKIAYDSLCFSFRYNLEYLENEKSQDFELIHVIGGGCQSEYFNQHISTICRKDVIAGPVEGAVIGNIIIQGISMGHISSIAEGREMVKNSFSFKQYSPEQYSEVYESIYMKYLNYMQNQK